MFKKKNNILSIRRYPFVKFNYKELIAEVRHDRTVTIELSICNVHVMYTFCRYLATQLKVELKLVVVK